MYRLAKLLEMMARPTSVWAPSTRKSRASTMPAVQSTVSMEHKGKVIAQIMADTEGKRRDWFDGIKVI